MKSKSKSVKNASLQKKPSEFGLLKSFICIEQSEHLHACKVKITVVLN